MQTKQPHIHITLDEDGNASAHLEGTLQQLCYMLKSAEIGVNKILGGQENTDGLTKNGVKK